MSALRAAVHGSANLPALTARPNAHSDWTIGCRSGVDCGPNNALNRRLARAVEPFVVCGGVEVVREGVRLIRVALRLPLFTVLLASALVYGAEATYPSRPVKIILASAPGS